MMGCRLWHFERWSFHFEAGSLIGSLIRLVEWFFNLKTRLISSGELNILELGSLYISSVITQISKPGYNGNRFRLFSLTPYLLFIYLPPYIHSQPISDWSFLSISSDWLTTLRPAPRLYPAQSQLVIHVN